MNGATLLHWHRKVGLWLPPGGHIEPNEDPMQAARREALEETGIVVELLPTTSAFGYGDPAQLSPPATIMVEPIGSFDDEDAHHHIDMIYFARPAASGEPLDVPADALQDALQDTWQDTWQWVSREQLEDDAPLTLSGVTAHISEDVRVLGMAAIDHVATFEESTA